MAPKNLVLLAALLLLAAAVGPAVGLIPSLSGIGNPVGVASGVVPCSIGSAIDVAAVPPVANANVQAVCGSTVVANATTDSSGAFTIIMVLNSLLSSQCRAVVTTPLVACNVSLAGTNGTLPAPLQLLGSVTAVGSIVGTILGIPVTVISGILALFGGVFSFVPNLG
uniref:Uncharacterized protein n=1 Tax=Setaria viridis TaxID=4556 RepID=A0A4V6D1V8_SETVI|nr:hypothetical protein SEVIR_9G413700v2 [Setaria viridis]